MEIIVPVILPFIDPETKYGFYINTVNHCFYCFCAIFLIPGCELFICVMKNNILAIATVIQNNLMSFGEMIENNKQYLHKYNSEFKNIILQALDSDR